MASPAIKLAVIGGDGIGPEVVAEALKVLQAADVVIDPTDYDLGAGRWHRTGETLPGSVLEEIRDHDAILLGAVGDPSVPSGVLERGGLARLAGGPRRGESWPGWVRGETPPPDPTLRGAVGAPSVPSGVLERGLLLRLRFE